MRTRIPWIAAVALALALVAPAAHAAAPSPFTGHWIGADPAPPDGDGSTLYLQVSGGPQPRVMFTDLYGSICVNDGAPNVVFTSQLTGTRDGDTLEAAFTWARCGPVFFDWLAGTPVTYTYDPDSDTIWDGFTTFHRG